MKLKIKGKEQELKFDVGFIRRLDEIYFEVGTYGGLDVMYGTGLVNLRFHMFLRSAPMLAEVIHCAVEGSNMADVEKAIENYGAEHGEIVSLFDKVMEAVKNSPTVALADNPTTTEETETKTKEKKN